MAETELETKPEETTTPAPETKPEAPEAKPDVTGKSSSDIKTLLGGESDKPIEKIVSEPAKPTEPAKEDDWFDKDRGFKTKDDALKSYASLQENLRQRAEREKALQGELEQIKQREAQRPLTEEEKTRQGAVEEWKEQNKDAISFLKEELKKDLKQEDEQEKFETSAMTDRKNWKESFDKDDSRKVLWPTMESIYSKGDIFRDFAKNPLPFIEALAFKQDFAGIAEKIRAEAVEQYKTSLKEAEAAEKGKLTGRPGGSKSTGGGDVDVGKMTSGEIAELLPRNEDG